MRSRSNHNSQGTNQSQLENFYEINISIFEIKRIIIFIFDRKFKS